MRNKKITLYHLSIVLFVFMIVASEVQNTFLALLTSAFCLVFINQPHLLIPHMLITSMFGDYFVAFSGVGMGRLLAMIFIASVFIKMVRGGRGVYRNSAYIYGLMSLYCVVSAFTSVTGSLTPAFVMVLNFLIIVCMQMLDKDCIDEMSSSLRACIMIMTGAILLLMLTGNAAYIYERFIFHESLNPNGLAMGLVQMSIIMIALLSNKKIKQNKFVSISFSAVLAVLVILTGSRTALIALLSAFSVISVYYGFTKKGGLRKYLYIVGPVVAILFINYAIEMIDLEVLERLTWESISETGGSGRQDIWRSAMKYLFPEHPLFGVGLGTDNPIMALTGYLLENNAGIHNMYITLLIQVGAVGLIIFMTLIMFNYVRSIVNIKLDRRMFLPVMMITAALFNGIGEEVYGERFLWMAIGFSLMIMNSIASEKKEKEKLSIEEI